MDENKNGTESLKKRLLSVNEQFMEIQMEMLERMAALERRVRELEGKLAAGEVAVPAAAMEFLKEMERSEAREDRLSEVPEEEEEVSELDLKMAELMVAESRDREAGEDAGEDAGEETGEQSAAQDPHAQDDSGMGDSIFDIEDGLQGQPDGPDDEPEQEGQYPDGEMTDSAAGQPEATPVSEAEPVFELADETAEKEEDQEITPDDVLEGYREEDMHPVTAAEEMAEVLRKDLEASGKELLLDKVKPDWYDWEVDYPGTPVDSVWDAIGFNDRLLFQKELFDGDSEGFVEVLDDIDGMDTLQDAVSYLRRRFPDWNEESDSVYRLYMSIRRRLK